MWDYNKSCDIGVIGVPAREKKEDEAEKVVKETVTENSPDLAKDINVQILKAQQILNNINPKNSMLIHNHIAKNEKKKKSKQLERNMCCL